MTWMRLEVKSMRVGWTASLPAAQYAAWVKFLLEVKESGLRGRCKASYFDAQWSRRYHISATTFFKVMERAVTARAVTLKDGFYEVTHWVAYQSDFTHARRQENYRNRQKGLFDAAKGGVTKSDASDATVQYSTVQTVQKKQIPPYPPRGGKEAKSATQLTGEEAAVLEGWNSLGEPFPKVAQMTAARRRTLKARLKDPWWSEHWRSALERVKSSTFCRGTGDRAWIADFEFFLRPNSAARILEGKYDDRRPAKAGELPYARRDQPLPEL